MKVLIRRMAEDGKLDPVVSLDDPFDMQIEIGERNQWFWIKSDGDSLQITANGRLVVFPRAENSVSLAKAKG